MSLITRCPACQTLFKVVPDQLRISEGWVRCGQCNETFDASLQLLPFALAADSPENNGAAPPLVPELAETLGANGADSNDATPWRIEDQFDESAPAVPEVSLTPARLDPNDLADPDRQRPDEVQEPSFLRVERTGNTWRNPLVRIVLSILGATLLIALGGQIVLHERDRIVSVEPRLRGIFLTLCRPLNCALSPIQQKNAVVIDGASFTRIKTAAYRLNFTLKNTAMTTLAMPAIELTLTDSLDQPVLRRVFLAPELGKASNTLPPASEWTASIAVAVKTASTAERVVGYRLLAFYP